jgi:hypothetical protein
MCSFTATLRWLVCTFFSWHCFLFYCFKNTGEKPGISDSPRGTPLPIVCERTAKVGENSLKKGLKERFFIALVMVCEGTGHGSLV